MCRKHKCCCCNNIATWYNEYGSKKRGLYYCDECVKRGSISNVDNIEDFGEPKSNNIIMWWSSNSKGKDLLVDGSLERHKDSFYYEILDEFGRRNPSDDFIQNKEGFLISENEQEYFISWCDISLAIDEHSLFLSKSDFFLIKDAICEIFLSHRDKFDRTKILYNVFMSKVGLYMTNSNVDFPIPPLKKDEIRKFYINLKKSISEKKVSK